MRWLPNILTLFRLGSAIPLGLALWRREIGLALSLLAVAGLTDLLDGYLAREFNWRSTLGAWLDPAADKTLITTTLITLTVLGEFPYWLCGLMLFRDLGLVIGTFTLLLAGRKVRIQPHLTGKFATVAQNLALLVTILKLVWMKAGSVLPLLLILAGFLTLISAVSYGRSFLALAVKK